MEARAVARYVLISPRKARQVTQLIQGKPLDEALNVLRFTPEKGGTAGGESGAVGRGQRGGEPRYESGRAYRLGGYVDEGPSLKRIRPGHGAGRTDTRNA